MDDFFYQSHLFNIQSDPCESSATREEEEEINPPSESREEGGPLTHKRASLDVIQQNAPTAVKTFTVP